MLSSSFPGQPRGCPDHIHHSAANELQLHLSSLNQGETGLEIMSLRDWTPGRTSAYDLACSTTSKSFPSPPPSAPRTKNRFLAAGPQLSLPCPFAACWHTVTWIKDKPSHRSCSGPHAAHRNQASSYTCRAAARTTAAAHNPALSCCSCKMHAMRTQLICYAGT